MRKHTDVIAMTNGMNVANALLEGVELLMTGGHLRQSQSFTAIRLSNRCKITTSICCFLV